MTKTTYELLAVEAQTATDQSERTPTNACHLSAASAHLAASVHAKAAGDKEKFDMHNDLATRHRAAAKDCQAGKATKVQLEAGGPGSGPHAGEYGHGGVDNDHVDKSVSAPAFMAGAKAEASKSSADHFAAADAHQKASDEYFKRFKNAIDEHGINHPSVNGLARMESEHKVQALSHKMRGTKIAIAEKTINEAGNGTATQALVATATARMTRKAALQASVKDGGYSFTDLQSNIQRAAQDNDTLATKADGLCSPCPWICDIICPAHEAGETWTAIVQGADGKLYEISFTIGEGSNVTLAGEPKPVERVTDYDYVFTPDAAAEVETKNALKDAALRASNPEGHNQYTESGGAEWTHGGAKRTDTQPYKSGTAVKTDSGEEGTISHVHVNEPGYPHSYRVTDSKNPEQRLENGNYISHNRLTPVETKPQVNLKDEDNWNTFGPGTGAKNQNANSFQKELPGGHLRGDVVQYNINPNSKGKFDLSTAGHPDSAGLWENHGTFNTHKQAMKFANDHYQHTIVQKPSQASDATPTSSLSAGRADEMRKKRYDEANAEANRASGEIAKNHADAASLHSIAAEHASMAGLEAEKAGHMEQYHAHLAACEAHKASTMMPKTVPAIAAAVETVTAGGNGKAGLEAGGPGSGRKPGDGVAVVRPNIEGGGSMNLTGKDYAGYLTQKANEATSKANDTKDVFDHAEAKTAHDSAAEANKKWGTKEQAESHRQQAATHWQAVTKHFDK